MPDEHPILFSGQMVRSILEGHKTQTRRVIKHFSAIDLLWIEAVCVDGDGNWIGVSTKQKGVDEWVKQEAYPAGSNKGIVCPYGKAGDRLWVRETFCLESWTHEFGDTPPIPDGRPSMKFPYQDSEAFCWPHYKATDPAPELCYEDKDEPGCRWSPSIFMPRWASRLTLEIVKVKVERVQDISTLDALKEGMMPEKERSVVAQFGELWNSINAKRGYGWDMNPYVWVISFRRLESAHA